VKFQCQIWSPSKSCG